MKKALIGICLLAASFSSLAQTCEEREAKLLDALGGFSAGVLYTSYSVIGSISDAYVHQVYTASTVSDLMDDQRKLMSNLQKMLDGLVKENMLKDQDDKNYVNNASKILKGLDRQARLLVDYTANKTTENQDAFDSQRKDNWADISKLMGLK